MPKEAGCITVTKWSVDGSCRFATTAQTEPWASCGGVRHTKLSLLFFKIIMHYSLANCSGWFLLNSESHKTFNINVLTKPVYIKFWFWLVVGGGDAVQQPLIWCAPALYSVDMKLSGPWWGCIQLQQQKALLPSGIEHLSSSHSAYRLVTVQLLLSLGTQAFIYMRWVNEFSACNLDCRL